MSTLKKLLSTLCLGLALSSCGSGDGFQEIRIHGDALDGGTDSEAFVQTLAIRPAYTKIKGIGKTLQLTADVWLANGDLVEDVQKSFVLPGEEEAQEQIVTWETENYGVATVDENGLVTTVSAGDTFITARLDGQEASARVIVESESSLDPNVDVSEDPL